MILHPSQTPLIPVELIQTSGLKYKPSAVLQTASEKGVYAIGNTTDQLKLAPDAVLTSAVKRIDLAVAYLAQLQAKGELKGEVYTIGFDQPEILYLGEFGDKIPAEVKEKAMEIKQAIVEQTIKLT
ncbi:MAG: BMP family ABC transporter substrate-binding protein [Merismopedia sp. SIO2A8]|nr:BMP family ABC transporter substrate-binding protein [Merismopedia sp. SIO2A8]